MQCFWEMNNLHLSEQDVLGDILEELFDGALKMLCFVGPGTMCEARMNEDPCVEEVKQVGEEVFLYRNRELP